jgi:hypothetical protein
MSRAPSDREPGGRKLSRLIALSSPAIGPVGAAQQRAGACDHCRQSRPCVVGPRRNKFVMPGTLGGIDSGQRTVYSTDVTTDCSSRSGRPEQQTGPQGTRWDGCEYGVAVSPDRDSDRRPGGRKLSRPFVFSWPVRYERSAGVNVLRTSQRPVPRAALSYRARMRRGYPCSTGRSARLPQSSHEPSYTSTLL